MVCSGESQVLISVRKERLCELFRHVGVFDSRSEGPEIVVVTKCIDGDG